MKHTLIFLMFLSSLVFPQEKYFIYFTDKGIENSNSLNKNSEAYIQAVEELSPKAIERRIKNMGNDFITYDDLPIDKNYIYELENLGVQIIRKLSWFNSVSANLTADQIEIVKTLPFVNSVEPVKKLYFQNDPIINPDLLLESNADTSYGYGVSLKQMNLSDVPIVHSKNINGENVLIGILDSGFDWKLHNSLKDRSVIAEYDFIFDDSVTANQTGDAPTQDSHGTYVFSILAGFVDSVLIGPAFNSSFILAKTEDIRSETHIEEDNYAAALIWMESFGVDITTSSLGYNIFDSGYSYTYSDMDGRTTIVTKAAEYAFQRGVSTFTSAGNEGNNSWKYIIAPADGYNIISVGAVDEFSNLAGFSSRGPTYDGRIKPEVVAFGVNTYGAVAGTNNGYRFASGTSAAAPIASGVAALLLSAHPHLKNTQMRSIILESASNSSNSDNQIGYGIISAKNAIEFPNLENINGQYILHKTIFDENINANSVNIVFQIADDLLEAIPMTKSGDYDFTYTFPIKSNGELVEFTIMFSDSQNNNYTLPQVGKYKFNYGSDIISLNLDAPSLPNYDGVSDFFPNPFVPANHKYVSFHYYTKGNEILNVAIIDGSGQKVKEFKITTSAFAGYYPFEWDGMAERGYLCASGVYYALIQLGGKEYGKKLVLLK
ncbi:MAG: S8 family serine peptidase [Ignavibacteriales bacterium]|nr:S8 family serine peptidase [Ignavibacteriales bacterium]